MDDKQRKRMTFSIGYFLLALLGVWLLQVFFIEPFLINRSEVPYSQFRQELADGKIDTVTLGGDRIIYTTKAESGAGEAAAEPEVHNVVAIDDPELTADL